MSLSLLFSNVLGQLLLVILVNVRCVLVNRGSCGLNGLVLVGLLSLLCTEHHEEGGVALGACVAVFQSFGTVAGWTAKAVACFTLACEAAVAEIILPQVISVNVVVGFVL